MPELTQEAYEALQALISFAEENYDKDRAETERKYLQDLSIINDVHRENLRRITKVECLIRNLKNVLQTGNLSGSLYDKDTGDVPEWSHSNLKSNKKSFWE